MLEITDVPALDDLTAVQPPLSPTILGLFRGPPETEACDPGDPCRSIVLYRRNLSRFARDRTHFDRMIGEMWRVLAPGGLFFARLASSIGIEPLIDQTVGAVRLPDGTDRFVVDERYLVEKGYELGAMLLDPIKTTNVQQQRCMTTWVVQKNR